MTFKYASEPATAMILPVLCLLLAGCEQNAAPATAGEYFTATGVIRSATLDEISGIEPGPGPHWYVHNDDGKAELHVVDPEGHHLAAVQLDGAKNRDWEDLTSIPSKNGDILVVGDIGDNHGLRKSIRLYMVAAPVTANGSTSAYPPKVELLHTVSLHYPDGRRDCEAMAFDAGSGQILLMSKRDFPPRLYGIDARQALQADELTMTFLGTVAGLRPPSPMELVKDPDRGAWISEPTGMDINADGDLAVVITYRSLYLYRRDEAESWPQAFQKTPTEIVGPPGRYDEAVAFSRDQRSIVVTGEKLPATIYRLDLSRVKAVGLQ